LHEKVTCNIYHLLLTSSSDLQGHSPIVSLFKYDHMGVMQ